MTSFLITYDLQDQHPDPHKPFLTAAEKEGLLYVWKGVTYVNRLPNTTVWGIFETAEQADLAFERALTAAGKTLGNKINLEKRATTAMESTLVRSDKRKEPEDKWKGASNFETSRLHQLNDPFFK